MAENNPKCNRLPHIPQDAPDWVDRILTPFVEGINAKIAPGGNDSCVFPIRRSSGRSHNFDSITVLPLSRSWSKRERFRVRVVLACHAPRIVREIKTGRAANTDWARQRISAKTLCKTCRSIGEEALLILSKMLPGCTAQRYDFPETADDGWQLIPWFVDSGPIIPALCLSYGKILPASRYFCITNSLLSPYEIRLAFPGDKLGVYVTLISVRRPSRGFFSNASMLFN